MTFEWMTANMLYWLGSTIAQAEVALLAFGAFLGIWRRDSLWATVEPFLDKLANACSEMSTSEIWYREADEPNSPLAKTTVQSAVGWSVTLKWSTRLRSCARTRNTNSTRKLAVGTVKKSTDTMSLMWFARKACQACDGGPGRRGMSRDTVRSEISMPSLRSSPWMRGAPQSGLALAIRSTSSRTSRLTGGRPARGLRDFHLQ